MKQLNKVSSFPLSESHHSQTTPSLRVASMSSPALHLADLTSHASSSPTPASLSSSSPPNHLTVSSLAEACEFEISRAVPRRVIENHAPISLTSLTVHADLRLLRKDTLSSVVYTNSNEQSQANESP